MIFLMNKNDPSLQSNPRPVPTWLSWHAGEKEGDIYLLSTVHPSSLLNALDKTGPDSEHPSPH